jgi:glycogen debranching enzyme
MSARQSSPRCGFLVRTAHKVCRITRALALAAGWLLLCALPAASQNATGLPPSGLPQLSRAVRHGEFLSSVGQRAALLGTEDGRFEAWVYPLKILRDLHLRFHVDGRILPAEALAQTVITRPESNTVVYRDASFQVRETLFVPIHEAGAIIMFDIQTSRPLEIELAFRPDFQLEWPADLGMSRLHWDSAARAFLFSAQDHPYAALIGSPTASNQKPDPEFDPQSEKGPADPAPEEESSLLLGVTKRGKEKKLVCIAASLQGRDAAAEIYNRLIRGAHALMLEAANYYRDALHRTLNISIPDARIQQAYDWARIDLLQAIVDNPLVGTGLIAGYGPSGEAERPGYDWFFGRDALWTSLALDSEGDFPAARIALQFLGKYQRADGKIPHEVPQSASLIPWFENYPYGYASADATPLFLIAIGDYVQRSGDVPFAAQNWDSIWRAYQFLNSTRDADGFAQNLGVGHGWVEGGPLLPVRTEIYQAGLGIEALRAISSLARLTGKNEIASELDKTFERERTSLNDLFWSPEKRIFAFALDPNNRRVDESTVLPSVPMWFGLLDPAKAAQTIAHFAAPDMQTDWGMRILSSFSARYARDGYHFGSVWPLFTGWASVAEYRYHRDLAAYLNLRANALLALDGSLGHVTEVLDGDNYKPLATSTPQQIWSAAMIVSPLLRGLFGLETDATACRIALSPHLPADWTSFTIGNLRVGSATLTLRFHRNAKEIRLETTHAGNGKCTLEFSPALSLRASVAAATLNGRAIPFRVEPSDVDQHASVRFELPVGRSTLRIRISDDFECSVASRLPAPGSPSQGLRILSSAWTPARDRLDLDVAGLPGNTYEFSLSNVREIVSVEGAELTKAGREAMLVARFSPGPDNYVQRRITLHFVLKRRAASQAKN